MFDFIRFAKDNKIMIAEEGSNTSPGWANIQCPFCDDQSTHLGFNIENGGFNCWRCGPHSVYDVIRIFKNCSLKTASQIYYEYQTGKKVKIKKVKFHSKKVKLPEFIQPLEVKAKKYLKSRNFDPDMLITKYNLQYVDNIGDYKFRIIAPINYQGQIVSYQGRDITGRQELRYKACSEFDEVIHYKNILYNMDNATKDYAIVMEGITDVWKIGDDTIATFGTGYTQEQVLLLIERYKKIFILFDTEEIAMKKAKDLGGLLNSFGVDVEIVELFGVNDPANLSDEEANDFKSRLFEKGGVI